MLFKVTYEGEDNYLTIQAENIDEAWEKAKRLGNVLDLRLVE